MALVHSPNVVTRGLKFLVDRDSAKSGANLPEVLSGSSGSAYSDHNDSWADGMNNFSVNMIFKKLGTNTAYARHVISKWSGTTDASFVLYHFQNLNGTDPSVKDRIGFYGYAGGTWQQISNLSDQLSVGTYIVGFSYDNTNGGQLWINGEKISTKRGSGTLGTNSTPIKIDSDGTTFGEYAGVHRIEYAALHNVTLTDDEMVTSYQGLKGRL
jgi:hypothetical protein